MQSDLDALINQMTPEEKARLCSGLNFWYTKPVERLDIPSIMMTDGPHGLRKQKDNADMPGINESHPATCFPTASTTSCSFDRALLREIGNAIAHEMFQEKIAIILGPGTNIKRNPLCGRNFEYFSEDPLLAGELAAAFIEGVQSQGLGTSLKHFACNNQEKARMINDSIVDERALREIYLAPFEIAVRKSQPWTIMCSYNKINGIYACENGEYLSKIAREDWGFEGAVVSDWGATDERVWALKAGMDLEMPYAGPDNDASMVEAVKNGTLDLAVLDAAVSRILGIVEKYQQKPAEVKPFSVDVHDMLARKAAAESAVLLKNDSILPIKTGSSLAVIGAFAETPRYQGSGSSRVNPTKITNAVETLEKEGIAFAFAKGYSLDAQGQGDMLIEEAVANAEEKDTVVVFAGLPDVYESEGYDREGFDLPKEQNVLIEKLAAVNPNIVVVLHTGSPVRMPWIDKVKGVLLAGLGGQCVGAAVIDLLFGRVNPSGKLSETYPVQLSDVPSYNHFGQRLTSEYRESIFVGYRYYEKAQKEVLFPFGHGLSYTQFTFSDLQLSTEKMRDDERVQISLKVKNTGDVRGKEVIQLYVGNPPSTLFKADKELRGFEKVDLQAGEEKIVSFSLGKRAFAYWNVLMHAWHVESGIYTIMLGSSSSDIRLQKNFQIDSSNPDVAIPEYIEKAPSYYNLTPQTLDIPREHFEVVLGREILEEKRYPEIAFNQNSTLGEAKNTFVGRQILKIVEKKVAGLSSDDNASDESMHKMIMAMIYNMPIRAFSLSEMPKDIFDGIILLMNKKYIRGLIKLLKKPKGMD